MSFPKAPRRIFAKRSFFSSALLVVALLLAAVACPRPTFYDVNEGRAPRWLLIRALDAFESEDTKPTLAVDAGFGNGIETLWLLEHGFTVYAHDISRGAKRSLMRRVPAELLPRLHAEVAPFHQATWPANVDLVFAGLSLPFARPQEFHIAWNKLQRSLACGGRFAGHLFGERDSWASGPQANGGTFFSEQQARALLDRHFAIEFFRTEDRDGVTASGIHKHWHVFHVIARKVCKAAAEPAHEETRSGS